MRDFVLQRSPVVVVLLAARRVDANGGAHGAVRLVDTFPLKFVNKVYVPNSTQDDEGNSHCSNEKKFSPDQTAHRLHRALT